MSFSILLRTLLILPVLFLSSPAVQAATQSLHHELEVTLFPEERKLCGTDTLNVHVGEASTLFFQLAKSAAVSKVEVEGRPRRFAFEHGRLNVPLEMVERKSVIKVTVTYSVIFDDPIPQRPANMDNPGYGVAGIISDTGSFLQAGAGWYPEITGSKPTYRLSVDAPEGILAVSEGRNLGHKTEDARTLSSWDVRHPLEGLSLSAGRYIFRGRKVGNASVTTYLLPESDDLSRSYLDATARYIAFYEQLIGPYPFAKFAVVENFFPTGYGFPSYTLMGSSIIRLPFIIHTSLGHEIAHCWWGNGVFVDLAKGNWCEGLTTYLSDYLFKENASEKAARDYRMQLLRKFATLVDAENDIPLKRFRNRHDAASQAIGYGKGAMVFHMLRRRLGEKAFWGALREIYRDRLFQRTSWQDFQEVFERYGKCSLGPFFDHWLSRKGAPRLVLDCNALEKQGDSWKFGGFVVQAEPFYDLDLYVSLRTRTRTVLDRVTLTGRRTPFQLTADAQPETFTLDPDFDVFRRLHPSEVPPSINAVKGSPSVIVVIPELARAGTENVARTLILSLGLRRFKIVSESELQESLFRTHDAIFISFPRRDDLFSDLPEGISIENVRFVIHGKAFEDPSDAFFGVFGHPSAKGRYIALFLPLSSQYAEEVARKITHYGKYSYLAFSKGRNRVKGTWPVTESPLVCRWQE